MEIKQSKIFNAEIHLLERKMKNNKASEDIMVVVAPLVDLILLLRIKNI